MRLVSWSSNSVRVDCNVCGAHTLLELEDYLTCAYGRYPAWCSTCGALRDVAEDGHFTPAAGCVEAPNREQRPEAQLSMAE
jgi:hypothetical protein